MISAIARAPFRLALAKVQATYVKMERHTNALEESTHTRIGGSRVKFLRRAILFPASKGLCVCCRQVTSLDVPAHAPNAATAALLIPAAMAGGIEYRGGYLPGNVANMCRTCVNLSNNPVDHSQLWMWTADILDAESVPLVWPPISKWRGQTQLEQSNVDPVLWRRECLRVMAGRGISPLPM